MIERYRTGDPVDGFLLTVAAIADRAGIRPPYASIRTVRMETGTFRQTEIKGAINLRAVRDACNQALEWLDNPPPTETETDDDAR